MELLPPSEHALPPPCPRPIRALQVERLHLYHCPCRSCVGGSCARGVLWRLSGSFQATDRIESQSTWRDVVALFALMPTPLHPPAAPVTPPRRWEASLGDLTALNLRLDEKGHSALLPAARHGAAAGPWPQPAAPDRPAACRAARSPRVPRGDAVVAVVAAAAGRWPPPQGRTRCACPLVGGVGVRVPAPIATGAASHRPAAAAAGWCASGHGTTGGRGAGPYTCTGDGCLNTNGDAAPGSAVSALCSATAAA